MICRKIRLDLDISYRYRAFRRSDFFRDNEHFFYLLKHLDVSPTKGRYDAREQGDLFAMQVCSNSCSILQLQKIDDNA